MRVILKASAILLFGALALSPAIAYLDLDLMPGDIVFRAGTVPVHIPVIYSLCASTGLALLTYFLKR